MLEQPPTLLDVSHMPPVRGLEIPRDLHVVLRSPALLAGMPARSVTPERLRALHDAGFRHLVRLNGSASARDVAPLYLAHAVDLEDLSGERTPLAPPLETRRIHEAADIVLGHLQRGEGVVVHCVGGRGRTGTVLAVVLVRLGVEPDRAIAHLDAIHRQRGKMGWPESPWQSALVHSFDVGGVR